MPSQAPHDTSSWESAFQASGQQSPFGTAPATDDTPVHGSFAPYNTENAPIYSSLVRRSRSLTDADIDSIDSELQPSGRRRSFFSPKKPKAAPDQTSASASSMKQAPRSFSGLLPSQLGREDSRSLLDSDRDGAKSFTVRSNKSEDADSSTGKAKSNKWWSWGSSKAPPKPDGKLAPAARQNSEAQHSLPVWSSDSMPHSDLADGAGFTSQQQQGTSTMAQDRYADLLSGLGLHNGGAAAASHPAPLASPTDQSPRASKQADRHSRNVSWDASTFNGSAMTRPSDELPRSQAESQPSQRLDSTDLPDNFATASLVPSAAPITAAAPSEISTGTTAGTAVVTPVASPSEVDSPAAVAAVDGEKKKGHRRGRSLTGLIPTLKTKPKRSVSELLPAEPTTPAAGSGQARPKTPDAKAASSNSSLGQCFGMGRTLDDAAEKEEAPPGVVGLRNLGNTCFVNVALQCLRYTPQLATAIIPDLMTLSPLPEAGSVSNSSSALPRISLQQSPVKRSSHEHSTDLLQSGSPQQSYSAAQSLGSHAAASQQQGMLSQEEGSENQHVDHEQPQTQHTSGHAVAPQHGDVPAVTGIPETSSVMSPSQRYDEGKQHLSSPQELDAQPAHPAVDSTVTQQQGSSLLQGAGAQQQSVNAVVDSDDGAAAALNESTAEKQPLPVAPVRIPLQKGEIADSFRALVREVYSIGGHNSRKEAVDPAQFLKRISQLSAGAEFCDGGQHDGHELLRLLLHSLHDDLNRITKKPAYEEDKDISGEEEADKADRFWRKYLERDNSPITDLFGGQLQSTVHCHKCKGNFTTYEPFWDLSVPIAKEGKSGISAWLSGKTVPTTIQDCLQTFSADEILQGDESFKCEVCGEKTQATKRMRLHRLPKVLLLHIKRFKYSGSSREKLTANVSFPTKALKLNQFVSADSSPADSNASYDLYAVSNHFGSMAGGHYTAACRVGLPDGREQWYNFNDTAVAKLSPAGVVSACAYLLFYVRAD